MIEANKWVPVWPLCYLREPTYKWIVTLRFLTRHRLSCSQKTPFSSSMNSGTAHHATSDLSIFYKECQTAPPLISFREKPVAEMTKQLEDYEARLRQCDSLIASMCLGDETDSISLGEAEAVWIGTRNSASYSSVMIGNGNFVSWKKNAPINTFFTAGISVTIILCVSMNTVHKSFILLVFVQRSNFMETNCMANIYC